jgi:RNA-directed DNA polymerase
MNEETQMTAIEISAGASSTLTSKTWDNLSWDKIDKQVTRLQMRIAKAERDGKKGRVKALQRILTSSFYAKCLAVKRVVRNKGGKTPGVDGIIWRTSRQKIQAVGSLKRHGYNPMPSKRIYVPKRQKGKLRPISIPTMKDKAMQALWLMALVPIAEQRADTRIHTALDPKGLLKTQESSVSTLSLEPDLPDGYSKETYFPASIKSLINGY